MSGSNYSVIHPNAEIMDQVEMRINALRNEIFNRLDEFTVSRDTVEAMITKALNKHLEKNLEREPLGCKVDIHDEYPNVASWRDALKDEDTRSTGEPYVTWDAMDRTDESDDMVITFNVKGTLDERLAARKAVHDLSDKMRYNHNTKTFFIED